MYIYISVLIYYIDTVRDSNLLIDHNASYNLIIVNTEKLLNKDDDDLVMHWLGIVITHTGETIFLDSFALTPNKYSDKFKGFLRNIDGEIFQCPYRKQPDDSQFKTISPLILRNLSSDCRFFRSNPNLLVSITSGERHDSRTASEHTFSNIHAV